MTASHVVHDAASIHVVLGNGCLYVAEVIGDDPENDLAAVRIDIPNQLFAQTGRPAREGDRVVAISTHRDLYFYRALSVGGVVAVQYQPVDQGGRCVARIRADILLRRGSSGGPLVNASGQVVGVTCSRDSWGHTLAAPINTAIFLLDGWLRARAARPVSEEVASAAPSDEHEEVDATAPSDAYGSDEDYDALGAECGPYLNHLDDGDDS